MQAESLQLLQAIDDGVAGVFEGVQARTFAAGEELVAEGASLDRLLLVSSGVCRVSWQGLPESQRPCLGPGSVIGDVSLLLGGVTRARIVALESVDCLELPKASLEEVTRSNPALALRIYRALATINAQRLIQQTHHQGLLQSPPFAEPKHLNARVGQAIRQFKDAAAAFEADLRRTQRNPDLLVALKEAFRGVELVVHEVFPALSGAEPALDCASLQILRTELLPYLLLTRSAERMYRKPRGYAGDFLTIDWMYADEPGGAGELGVELDRCFLDEPAAQAVRNRRGLLREELQRSLDLCAERPLRVTSLACGPAAEIFDLLQDPQLASQLELTLVDVDQQALDHVRARLDREQIEQHLPLPIRLERRNLLHLCIGRQRLELKPQHLMYSIGLIDYFDDRIVTRLQAWIHQSLVSGGRSILGNFHPDNSTRGLMDQLLDWRLIHRDQADMERLAQAAGFAPGATEMRFEPSGVNLFAISTRV